jgi:hypothetical protein
MNSIKNILIHPHFKEINGRALKTNMKIRRVEEYIEEILF